MRLIGIKIERMDSTIQKVLNPGWYPFGDYEEPKANGFLYCKPVSYTEHNLYKIRKRQPEVSVSCIVGMNGSGKSTIIEIILRILNNLAVRQCERIGSLVGTDMNMHTECMQTCIVNATVMCVLYAVEIMKYIVIGIKPEFKSMGWKKRRGYRQRC